MPAPQIPGYAIVWLDEFNGPHYAAVNGNNWISKTGANANHELQQYTTSTENAHLSGDGRLYIIPKKAASGQWTSARLEGKSSFTCDDDHTMIFQSEIRVGNHPAADQKGIWPAFWALGNNIRTGTSWPKCGEWDILELINGSTSNQGTLHFLNSGGAHQQFGGGVNFTGGNYHIWALKVDRRGASFRDEKLTWYLDNHPFFEVTGAQIGTAEQWSDVAHKPFYPLLNVAVGGDYPGNPNAQTLDGFDSGMQVKYVAVYKSNGPVAVKEL